MYNEHLLGAFAWVASSSLLRLRLVVLTFAGLSRWVGGSVLYVSSVLCLLVGLLLTSLIMVVKCIPLYSSTIVSCSSSVFCITFHFSIIDSASCRRPILNVSGIELYKVIAGSCVCIHIAFRWLNHDGGYGQLAHAECESTLKQPGMVSPLGEDVRYKDDGLQ